MSANILCVLALIATCALPQTASAYSLDDYNTPKYAPFMKTYLTGLGDGFDWANRDLEFRGEKKLFCTPVALNTNNYRQLIYDFLHSRMKEKMPLPGGMSIGGVLLQALIEAFPCEKV